MALHSKSDFAKLCDLTTSNITTYVVRGKLVMSGDYIDDNISQNCDFLKKKGITIAKSDGVVMEKVKKELKVEAPGIPEPKMGKVERAKESGMFALDMEKKELEIEKEKIIIQLNEIRRDKLQGTVIPTELVKMVFSQHSASISTAFKHGADNLLMEISKTKGLNRNEMAELRGKLVKMINTSVNDAIASSKKLIAGIVAEYSDKREVGERDQ